MSINLSLLTASLGKKLNTTTIGSDRQRIWLSHIILFENYAKQTFERSLQWLSILLENENFENPEYQVFKNSLASFLVLNTLIDKMGTTNLFKGKYCKWSPVIAINLLHFNELWKSHHAVSKFEKCFYWPLCVENSFIFIL